MNSLTNRSSSRLEESKHKVHRNNKEVSKHHAEGKEVKPKRNIDQEKTCSGTKQSNCQHGSGVEGITQLARDDVTSGIGTHEDGVHLRQDEWIVTCGILKLLLHGGVTFTGEMRHEVATEGNEEGPSIGFMKRKGFIR